LSALSESLAPGYDDVALSTRRIRAFLSMADDEPTELTFFVEGRIFLAQVVNVNEHIRALSVADGMRGFNGSYQLVNGPLVPELFARYEPNKVHRAWNGRANDANVRLVRSLFIDCDPKRIKGISSTDEEKASAADVAVKVYDLLAGAVGQNALGIGDSGNGYFLLVALEPVAPSQDVTNRISALLALLQRKFGTDLVKIDCSVSNPARLMPAPGTWKRKGWSTPERPHRKTSFGCTETVKRVPLEVLA
jgi:hypothetical protein